MCATECKQMGGDEILFYDKGANFNYICCQSTTPEQKAKGTKSCDNCRLVDAILSPSFTTTTPPSIQVNL
jgi:hypothetical protein